MGNTTSIASNILVFPVPDNSNIHRRRGRGRGRIGSSSTRGQTPRSPGDPSYRRSTSQANVSCTSIPSPHLHSPRSPRGPCYLPSPTHAQTPPTRSHTSPPHPRLTVHHILPPSLQPLASLLHALTTSLRDPADRTLRPSIAHTDWTPTAIFHLTGDFSTPISSALCSVLLMRTTVSINARGEEDVLGQHCFVHVFEAAHLAQSFEEMIGEWESKGWVKEVDVEVEEGVEEMLEACALGAVGSWVNGMGEEGEGGESWIGGRMMERAEEVFWGMWLGSSGKAEGEEETRSTRREKWWGLEKLMSRIRIW